MEIDRALEQIDHIYGHLERTEVYRGYRPVPVAITGVLAVAAAVAQPWVVASESPVSAVLYWVVIAAASLALITVDIIYEYAVTRSSRFRRSTFRVLCQFLPCLAAGVVFTVVVGRRYPELVPLLPGGWALLFSLGIFASRPSLPRAIGWVGLFYFAAGSVVLLVQDEATALSPWAMGAVFGPGQLAAAAVLHCNLERRDHVEEERSTRTD